MSIRKQIPPNLVGVPKVDFVKNNFDSATWQHGYDVIKYDAIQCPCRTQGSDNISTCQNCLGLGWVYINSIETKAILTSINTNTKYKYWSPEFKGTMSATLLHVNRLSFMDKIVMKNSDSVLSEVRPVKTSGTQKFIFTSYPVKSINSIFLFNGPDNSLIRLTSGLYSISEDNPYVIKLSSLISFPTGFNNVVSIDYNHNVQYNVVDIPHNIRSTTVINQLGQIKPQDMPIQAIVQLSHYITGDSPKYDGTGIKDNSYL